MRTVKMVALVSLMMAATAFAQTASTNKSSALQAPNNASPGAMTALPETHVRLGGNDPSQRIAREVLHELLMEPYYSVFDNLAFRVDGNKVTLLGQVVNSQIKSDAEKAVRRIEGVEQVENDIQILPPLPGDDRIRRAEYRAIYGSSGLSRYSWGAVPSIHIVVSSGHVTLDGVVDSQADKNLAGIQANQVPGVFSVQNNLQVANPTANNSARK